MDVTVEKLYVPSPDESAGGGGPRPTKPNDQLPEGEGAPITPGLQLPDVTAFLVSDIQEAKIPAPSDQAKMYVIIQPLDVDNILRKDLQSATMEISIYDRDV